MTAHAARARPASPTAALFGAVMALVALTVGFATLGVYLGRNSGGAAWFVAWLLSLGCLIGLNVATRRGQNGLALGLLLVFGALTGWSVATTINYYAETDPLALRQAFGATALTVAALGAGGYAVRRDLSFLYRILFWLLLALLAAGVVLIFIRIPALYTVWSLLGLALFCVYTVGRLQSFAPRRQRRGNSARGVHLHRRSQHLPVFPAALRPPLLLIGRQAPAPGGLDDR
jgi:FtsH-binding integral membrane protein